MPKARKPAGGVMGRKNQLKGQGRAREVATNNRNVVGGGEMMQNPNLLSGMFGGTLGTGNPTISGGGLAKGMPTPGNVGGIVPPGMIPSIPSPPAGFVAPPDTSNMPPKYKSMVPTSLPPMMTGGPMDPTSSPLTMPPGGIPMPNMPPSNMPPKELPANVPPILPTGTGGPMPPRYPVTPQPQDTRTGRNPQPVPPPVKGLGRLGMY